jgi:hypothetical protein
VAGKKRVVGYPEIRTTSEDVSLDRDDHVTLLLAGYALGALDPDETELVTRHVQRCDACRDELAGYEAVTGMLPYAAPPLPVPVRSRAALLSRIDEIGMPNYEQMVVLEKPASSWQGIRRFGLQMPRYAVFSAIPLVIILALVLVMGEIINDQQSELRATQTEKNDGVPILMGTDDPRFMTEFVTVPDVGGNARGRLFIDRAANTAMIVAINLPEIGDDHYFVAWFRLNEPYEHARAGVLEVDDKNRTQLIIEPVSPIAAYESLVITIEADPETAVPNGPEVMTAGMYPDNFQIVP